MKLLNIVMVTIIASALTIGICPMLKAEYVENYNWDEIRQPARDARKIIFSGIYNIFLAIRSIDLEGIERSNDLLKKSVESLREAQEFYNRYILKNTASGSIDINSLSSESSRFVSSVFERYEVSIPSTKRGVVEISISNITTFRNTLMEISFGQDIQNNRNKISRILKAMNRFFEISLAISTISEGTN